MMMRCLIVMAAGLTGFAAAIAAAQDSTKPVHLFILSGQSNMVGLDSEMSFTPSVTEAFPDSECIVVKSAQGGQPIRRWYKRWIPAPGTGEKPEGGDPPKTNGDLYDKLMKVIKEKMGDKEPATVTFIWMQGERDAREEHGAVYAASLRGLIDQLKKDLGRKDVNFVIGRLSDFDNDNARYPHWTMVREAQMKVAQADPCGEWVDTDDLNGKNDALHYDKPGYKELGKRFAEKSIELVKRSK